MTRITGLLPQLTGNENIWIFQSSLPHFSIAKTVDALDIGDVGTWYVTDHRDDLRGGDLVLLWEEGEDAGLYALGTLVGDIFEGEPTSEGGPPAEWMRWRLDAKIAPPVTKAELRAHHALQGLKHFDRRDVTAVAVDRAHWDHIKEILDAEPGFEPVVGD